MARLRDPNASWERDVKLIFCELCLKEVERGNRPTTHFNKEGWSNITVAFREKTGREYNKPQLKNKWDALKKDWKLWKELKRGSTGLGWDPVRKTIDASDDWWREKLEVLPSARKFRYAGIDPEFEEKLDRMFIGVVATGANAWTPSVEGADPLGDNDLDEAHDSSDDVVADGGVNVDSRDKSRSSHQTKRRRGGINFLKEGISTLVSSYSNLAACSSNAQRHCSIAEAVNELGAIPNIHENMDFFMYSTTILEDPSRRSIFLTLPAELREPYLRYHYEGRMAK